MKPITFLILLFASSWIYANPTILSTFSRVIDATPYDFIYSLRTVSPEDKNASQSGGRLQKYFKLVRKDTVGSKTDITIELQSEIVPEALKEYTLMTVKLEQLKDENDVKRFQTRIIFNNIAMGDALLSVSPDTQGSLLKLDIQQTILPLWIFKSAVDLLLKINLSSSEDKSSLLKYKPPATRSLKQPHH